MRHVRGKTGISAYTPGDFNASSMFSRDGAAAEDEARTWSRYGSLTACEARGMETLPGKMTCLAPCARPCSCALAPYLHFCGFVHASQKTTPGDVAMVAGDRCSLDMRAAKEART